MTVQPVDPDLPDLSIVVLSYNRHEELQLNLPDLAQAADSTGAELIVVDNASHDGSRAFLADLASRHPNLQVVYNDANLGVGGGRNSGWSHASRRFILNLDDDTRISLSQIEELVAALRAESMVGILFPRVLDVSSGRTIGVQGDKRCRPANFLGACHLVRTSVLSEIGYNDDSCSFGGEELDLSIRMRAAGYEVVFMPDVTVWHNGLPRDPHDDAHRREQWAGNISRVLATHFPLHQAAIYVLRIGLSLVVNGFRKHDANFALRIARACIQGAHKGRHNYKPIPPPVRSFYRSKTLRPDYGNIPLSHKLLRRMIHLGRSASGGC